MTTLVADMLSNFGDVLFYIALMTYVISLPDAEFAIAIISISEMLPTLLAIVVGTWADNTQRKLTMIFHTIVVHTIIYIMVGLLMGFSPALWVVIIVAALNFLSDICGKYESGLFIPMSLKIVSDELREESLAFRQTVSLTLDIAFRSLSALLITVVSYQQLAFINAGTFILSGLILLSIRSSLTHLLEQAPPSDEVTPITEATHDNKRSVLQQIKYTFEHFKEQPEIYQALLVIPFFNAVFSSIGILFILYIAIDPHFIIINTQVSIALLPILITISSLLGNTLALSPLSRSISMNTMLKCSSLLGIGIFVGFLYHNIIIVLVCCCFAVILSSIVSPKFSAAILNHLPQDSLTTALNSINTLLQIGMFAMTMLISWLITFLEADIVTIICLIPAIIVTGYLYFPRPK